MRKRWLIKDPPNSALVEKIKEKFKVSKVVAHLLVQRGITTKEDIDSFFRGSLKELHDPFLMKNMEEAVSRVNKALKEGERILIYGDYDVDGTTAVAMMYKFLSAHTSKINYYIPNRYNEGYGVSEKGIQFAKDSGATLIITLDCGIKANEMIDLANSYGIDTIICDHHTPGDVVPDAIVLNPKQEDCSYPYKELSGCGVGFKLLQALTMINEGWEKEELFDYLDLLAISIGADIVPVTGENRLLAQHGLKKLNKNTRFSLDYMLSLAQKAKPLTLTDVVFTIAPRINAAGRLDDANVIVKLFTSDDKDEIKMIADEIHELNEERRRVDKQTTEEAMLQILEDAESSERYTTVVYDENWHKGVVGIVASRLIESYYRPTIVLTLSEDKKTWTGSGRSIDAVNIYEVLEDCSHTLEKFGGHFHAAGLSIPVDKLYEFIDSFEEQVKVRVEKEDLIEEQVVERELKFNELFNVGESIREVPRLMRVLEQFEPYGPENMKPLFLATNVYAMNPKLLKDEHLKMEVLQPDFQQPIEAIYFRAPESLEIVKDEQLFDIVFTLEVNQFRGKRTPQLVIKDIRPHLLLN